jgi:hypothetical protein
MVVKVNSLRWSASQGQAVCLVDGCRGIPLYATRERARQHTQAFGHRTRYVVPDVTVYELDGDD